MRINFTKMHALGNDFILIDDRIVHRKRIPGIRSPLSAGQTGATRLNRIPPLSKKLCHRKFGIGADQLLLLCKSEIADFNMRIFNPDGSEAEMCGNGIRCLGKFIWDNNLKTQDALRGTQKHLSIETRAGIIHLQKKGKLITVDMGEPLFKPEKIPVNLSSELKKKNALRITHYASPIINYPLQVEDKTFRITCVSMGNPHTIIIVKDVQSVPLSHYGPLIENHKLFPRRSNVEFLQILNRNNIKMRVWERGAGETMACGTGASASGVASALLGLTQRRVTVHVPGGKLLIEWSAKNNHVYMTGPAVTVFEGSIEI